MKKLSFNSTLNHKRDGYNTYEVSVEKVITLCGDEFSKLKNFTLDDNRYIARYHKLMCIDSENVCLNSVKISVLYRSMNLIFLFNRK